MSPSAWTWTGILVTVLIYWAAAAFLWVLRQRRTVQDAEPAVIEVISDTEIKTTFAEEIRVLPFAVVALGPPLLLVILFLA